jgi:hypothetical protein
MAGIIEKNMRPEAGETEQMEGQEPPEMQGQEPTEAGGKFDHAAELKRMREVMPEKFQKMFDRIVLAGQKILYSKETSEMVDQFLSQDAPIEERLGNGVANIVVMIDNKSNGAIPKEVLVPAGTVLLFDAADFLTQTGETISTEQIGKAYEMMFYGIFAAYGAEPGQVDAVFDEMEQKHRQPTEQGV